MASLVFPRVAVRFLSFQLCTICVYFCIRENYPKCVKTAETLVWSARIFVQLLSPSEPVHASHMPVWKAQPLLLAHISKNVDESSGQSH